MELLLTWLLSEVIFSDTYCHLTASFSHSSLVSSLLYEITNLEIKSLFLSLYFRRTRNVFDVALRVHRTIQERDIEVGRNLGNRILRWLDRMKPEAHIRKPIAPPTSGNVKKQQPNHLSKHDAKSSKDGESNRHLFAVSRNVWAKPFPSMMMRPTGNSIQHRRYSSGGFTVYNTNFGFREVLRNDIKQWILLHH